MLPPFFVLASTQSTLAFDAFFAQSSKATGAVDLPEHARTGTEKQLNRKAQTYGFGLNDDDDDSVVLGDMAAL